MKALLTKQNNDSLLRKDLSTSAVIFNNPISTIYANGPKVQRKASCSCGGGCPACQAKSNDLKVSQPNDPAEIEADQIADRVMRMPVDDTKPLSHLSNTPNAIHRKCDACEDEEEEPGDLPVMRKETFASAAPTPPPDDTPPSIKNVINSGGHPLDPATRIFFEPRFNADLSRVRIHTGDNAAESARSINARAYTLGNNIVFGSGEYKPESEGGRYLLAHELVHVGQQLHRAQRAMIQRTEGEEESPETNETSEAVAAVSVLLARQLRTASPVALPETIIAAVIAAETSFLLQSYSRLVERGDGTRIFLRLGELASPSALLEFNAMFVWGLLQGLVSPVTGLVHLAVGLAQLQMAADQWLMALPSRMPELAAEARVLAVDLAMFTSQAAGTLATMQTRGGMQDFALAAFEAVSTASDEMERYIVGAAERQGRSAANSLVDHFLTTPLPELAETVGEILGTVVIELIILVFTDGIGNLITKLGEFARTLRPLARGIPTFISVAIEAGRVIAEIEHLIGILLSRTVLRPLMPLFESLEPLLGRFRQFVQRLVGIGERSTASLAGAGAGAIEEGAGAAARTTERVGAGHPPPRSTPPRRTAPRVSEPAPAPAPRVTEPTPPPAPRLTEPAPAPAPGPAPEIRPTAPPPAAEARVAEPISEPRVTEPAPEPRVTEPAPEPRATEPTPETAPEPDARRSPEAAGLNADDLAEVGPINDETLTHFREHPDQLHAWAENPRAAAACKMCASDCFPNMTPDQIRRMERLMGELDRSGLVLEHIEPNPANLIERLKNGSTEEIGGILDRLESALRAERAGLEAAETLSDPMVDPADRGTLSGSPEPDVPTTPGEAEAAAADRAERGLTHREVWEPPPGVRPRPPHSAPQSERLEWMHERLQMHVDEAIERYNVEGLTPNQAATVAEHPHMEAMYRGSRIDQFAKDTIMQDLELADAITAPDFISEPDILVSSIDEWFDITTPNAWEQHILDYMERYGTAARLLPTRP